MGDILAGLKDPSNQYPSIVLLLGGLEKVAAERALFPTPENYKPRGLAQIRLDRSTFRSKHPVLVSTLTTDLNSTSARLPRDYAGEPRHALEWFSATSTGKASRRVADKVTSTLIMLFVDVICVFLDDFPSHKDGFTLLQQWASETHSTRSSCPKIIFITRQQGINTNNLELEGFIDKDVRHLTLPRRTGPEKTRSGYAILYDAIHSDIHVTRRRKQRARSLLSAVHLNRFFICALRHVSHSIHTPFDFIAATREYNPVGTELNRHVETFVRLSNNGCSSPVAIAAHIASALLLDSLPPGMHSKTYCQL
jgi:hypothetical protein